MAGELMLGCPDDRLGGLGVLYVDITACQAANATTALTPQAYAECYTNNKLPKQQAALFPTSIDVTPSIFQNPGLVIPTTGGGGLNPLLTPSLSTPKSSQSSNLWLWLLLGGVALVVMSGRS